MPDYEWRFEECSPEGAKDIFDQPWRYATRGGRLVETGYGHTERGAMDDVKRRCAERDRRANVGERGEVVGVFVAQDAMDALWFDGLREGIVDGGVAMVRDAMDAQQQWSNPLVSTWGPAKGSRWHEGM